MGWNSRSHGVSSFAGAAAVLKKRDTKKVANNTYVERRHDPEVLSLLYHRTHIIHWHVNGSITLNTGGWQTYSTKERLNSFTPNGMWQGDQWVGFAIQVWQQLGAWYVSIRTESGLRRVVDYQDNMVISPRGQVTDSDGVEIGEADVEGDRKAYLRTKARERRENLRNGLVWQGRGRFGGWRQGNGAPAPYRNPEETLRAQVERDLDERDRLWRAAQMRKASDDPASPSYVPEFAKGNGKA